MSQHDAPDAGLKPIFQQYGDERRLASVEDQLLYRHPLSYDEAMVLYMALRTARADLARDAALREAAERLLDARKERYAAQASTYDDPAPHPLPASWFDRIDAAWAAEDRAADDIAAALAQQEAT